jgi:hypothetical protein
MPNAWRRTAVAALAAGAAIAAQFMAIAPAQAAAPAVTIGATAKLPPTTGDVYVFYRSGAYATAKIHGKITGAATGDVAALYAQQFPYKHPAVRLSAITLKTATATYSFTVTPTLATRYAVRLFASATARTPLASSPAQNVYVIAYGKVTGGSSCTRPVCHETYHIYTIVPVASALSIEMGKHVYPYFGLNLSPTSEPPPPQWLYLNAGNAHVSAAHKISAVEFVNTLTLSFTIGNDGYYWNWGTCTRDTESKDGLGLPGYHDCGVNRIPGTKYVYLG